MRLYQRNEYFTHPLQNPTLLAIRKIKAMNYHHVRYSVCQSDVRQGKRAAASFSCQGTAITLVL
jgi:hypothetical protein